MKTFEIVRAIKSLKPTAEFSFTDDDYSTIKWDVLDGDAPTWEQIQDEHNALLIADEKVKQEQRLAKAAILDRLGITEEEAKILLS